MSLKIKFHDELPQWIISSDIAAYHPASQTIHIRRKLGFWRTLLVLKHELAHFAIHVLGLPEEYQSKFDLKRKNATAGDII